MSLHDQLHEQLDLFFATLGTEWQSPLEFSLHVGPDCATTTTTYRVDICKFLSGQPTDCPLTLIYEFAYFSRTEFPPPSDNTSDPFGSLRLALESASRQAGFELVSQGSAISKKLLETRPFPIDSAPPIASIRFTCKKYRTFRQRKVATESSVAAYRKTSLHNDKKLNSRGSDALSRPRKGTSQKSFSSELTCPFNFAVFLDKCGFLLKKVPQQNASTRHCHHMKRLPADIPTKIKQLTQAMQLQCAQLSNSCSRPSAARNFLNSNYNLNLTEQQARFAMRKFKGDGTCNINGQALGAEAVVDWLREQKDELSYCIWGAVPEAEQQANASRQAAVIFDRPLPAEFNEFSSDGTGGVEDLSELCQDALPGHQAEMADLNISENQNLFVACAWSTNKERRAFCLSPDVIKLDVTEGTNTEKRPLLTVSIRSAFGNYMVVARMFLSHQRRVSFRWAFSIALPKVLGESWISLVKAVMTDGDSNEIFELDEAIARWMPDAFRMRCAWHVIFKGWQRNCAGLEHTVERRNRSKYKVLARTIKKWCYTFCWPGLCETKEELHISKCLLLAFLNSKTVKDVIPSISKKRIQEFLVERVFIHDATVSMTYKKFVRCHNEVTNSSHEGTNYALKWHSAPVLPGQQLQKSAHSLKFQSDIKMNREARIAARAVEGKPTQRHFASFPTSGHLTDLCHELVVEQWELGNKYQVRRNANSTNEHSDYSWSVVHMDDERRERVKRLLYPILRDVAFRADIKLQL